MSRLGTRAIIGLLSVALATGAVALATGAVAQQATNPPGATKPVDITRLVIAIVVVVLAIVGIWLYGRRTTLLKDNLLPQIAPQRQPYSLGRWQMAFWFVIIFNSFVAIYIARDDFHSLNPQALWLIGISAASGVSAVVVDVIKDSPADAANRGLRALGLQTYLDVERTRAEIAERETQLKVNPPPANAPQLAMEIRDRQLLLTAYEQAIRPFVSQGWYKDLTTDSNGAALHRVQTLIWTIALGVVFVATVVGNMAADVATNLVMPQFDNSLLLLLGISNAGYIGFKYPEPQQ
jgi:hypothetical protein